MAYAAGKVSVIIPAYNYGRYLAEAVRSVRNQSYPDWEIVIVDDGSSDDTPQVGARLQSEDPSRIHFYRITNSGVSEARNFGIAHSSGEFIMPLDADDILMPTALTDFVEALRADPQSGYAYCNLENLGVLPGDLRIWEQGPFIRGRIVMENTAASASMWRRALFDQGVRYRHMIFEDWDLWLQIVAKGFRAAYVPKPLFQYRLHISGRTSRNRHLYYPALLQIMQHNPSLYDPSLVDQLSRCLINSPACWSKSTVVFLPKPGSAEYRSFDGPMSSLARECIRRGHFVVVIGEYPPESCPFEGVATMGVSAPLDISALTHRLGMVGASLLVVSGLAPWMNKAISGLKNVSLVRSFLPEEESAGGEALAEGFPMLRAVEGAFVERRTGLDLLACRSPESASQLAERLLAETDAQATARKQVESRYWEAMQELEFGSPPDGAALWERLRSRLGVVVPVCNPNLSALERSLSALREADRSVAVVLSDCGTQNTESRAQLPQICARHGVRYLREDTPAPFSRAFAFNVGARNLEREWLMLLPANVILAPHFFKRLALSMNIGGTASLYLGDGKGLTPLSDLELQGSFAELERAAYERTETVPEVAVIQRGWLEQIGGLAEELQGAGDELEELRWRSEVDGRRTVWLSRGILLRAFDLVRRSATEAEGNRLILAQLKQMPRQRRGDWGIRRAAFSTVDSSAQSWAEPAGRLEADFRRAQLTREQKAECLIVWGRHCLSNGQDISARDAFEGANALLPNNIDVLSGLGHCAARRGAVASMGHYAARVLRINEQHPDARAMMQHLLGASA